MTPSEVHLVEELRVEDARQRARAAERAGEADSLFVAKRDYFDRKSEAFSDAVHPRYDRDRDEHTSAAVETAGVTHRVDVRSKQQDRSAGRAAFVAADERAGGVYMRRHSSVSHPICDQGDSSAMRGREIETGDAAGLVAQLRKLIDSRGDLEAKVGIAHEPALRRARTSRSA